MEHVCAHAWCQKKFVVTEDDLEFYDKVSPVIGGKKQAVPPPKLCPTCRQQRRLAWRNEHHIYSRNCDLCKKHIVSAHRPDAPYPVYCVSCWWSDRWHPLDYGLPVDLTKPFLMQCAELQARVPQLAMQNDNGITSENSEYCYDVSRAKNCYRLIGSWFDENCHYSLNLNNCKSIIDCNTVSHSELCYECLDSQKLYHCAYLQNSENCRDCWFGFDLKGCSDCIACYGLRHQQYRIFNEQYSEKDFREKLQTMALGSHQTITTLRKQFDEWIMQFPRLYANLQNCEDCTGNNLLNCKSVTGWSVSKSEYSKYIDRSDGPKNCYDLINTGGSEWCLDCVTCDDSYMQIFSAWCWKCKYVLLSDNCHTSEHLLGCIALKRSKYCILNTQYTKEEYEALVPLIIESMQRDETWGEHLPLALSMFAYNESSAQEYYPLDKETVMKRGWRWNDALPYTTGRETIAWNKVPDAITEVPNSITNEILACEECQKNYKIIPEELAFYQSFPLPLPRLCPHCRHKRRFRKKTPTEIFERTCAECQKNLLTSYSPERPETIVCEECYRKSMYE